MATNQSFAFCSSSEKLCSGMLFKWAIIWWKYEGRWRGRESLFSAVCLKLSNHFSFKVPSVLLSDPEYFWWFWNVFNLKTKQRHIEVSKYPSLFLVQVLPVVSVQGLPETSASRAPHNQQRMLTPNLLRQLIFLKVLILVPVLFWQGHVMNVPFLTFARHP